MARPCPPYPLPDHKTRSTFKTDTHEGDGFNELRFEDKNGEEETFVHAQKDTNTKVEDHQAERVNANKVESVGINKSSEIGNNLTQVVDGDMKLNIGPGNSGQVTPSGADEAPEGILGVSQNMSEPTGSGQLTISLEQSRSRP